MRDPRTQPAPPRTTAVIGLRLLSRDGSGYSGNPDLTLQLRPVEDHRRVRIRRQLAALLAPVIGEEDESALVEAFEQNDAGRRRALRADGGQRHRVRLLQLRLEHLLEPAAELGDRFRADAALVQPRPGVFP